MSDHQIEYDQLKNRYNDSVTINDELRAEIERLNREAAVLIFTHGMLRDAVRTEAQKWRCEADKALDSGSDYEIKVNDTIAIVLENLLKDDEGGGESREEKTGKQRATNRPAPSSIHAVCRDCGTPYHNFPCDLVVPDDIWELISPTGHEGGLLCPNCLCGRLAGLGMTCVQVGGDFSEIRKDDEGAAVGRLQDVVQQANENHPLPCCEHGNALRDGAGDWLEPSCGCTFKDKDDDG